VVRVEVSTKKSHKFPKTNSKLVQRLVAYYEYQQALRRFGALLQRATPKDLKTIDEIIAERREFTIFTNLSRRLEKGKSTLTEKPKKPGDNFKRQGLAWVVALARVEVAAMLAGFTRTKRPFEKVGATRFDLPAYGEMLLDGLRTHYWSLAADPRLRDVTRGRLTLGQLLTYSRRLLLARSFHDAVVRIGKGTFNNAQQAELKTWGRNLEKLHGKILSRVQIRLDNMTAAERALLEVTDTPVP
jgi:hypothetical protein